MIHASLNCKDQIGALIRAERLRQYPEGTVVAGMELCITYAEHMLS
jgi:hypothetical protein